MFRLSNNLIGILNVVTFVLSIPIVWAGVWLSQRTTSECEQFLQKPLIVLGVFLMLVSIAGIIGACCRVSWLLWVYLLVMFLLILVLFVFTILAFVVTNQGAGQALNGKGYKEYRLGDYSDWLQNRVNGSNWSKIRSCLVDSKVCSDFSVKYLGTSVQQFYAEHLTPLQSGCCKPSDDCNFAYGGRPTGLQLLPPTATLTAMHGLMIRALFASTVNRARRDYSTTSRATGRRWLSSTSCSWSSSSLCIPLDAAPSGTIGGTIHGSVTHKLSPSYEYQL